jgi:hypothetical protein
MRSLKLITGTSDGLRFDPIAQSTEDDGFDQIERQELVGEAQRNGTCVIKPLQLFWGKGHLQTADVVLNLGELAGTDDGNDRD